MLDEHSMYHYFLKEEYYVSIVSILPELLGRRMLPEPLRLRVGRQLLEQLRLWRRVIDRAFDFARSFYAAVAVLLVKTDSLLKFTSGGNRHLASASFGGTRFFSYKHFHLEFLFFLFSVTLQCVCKSARF